MLLRNWERKINYREAFGKLNLFHIVSMSGINESHYNEDDPDFEEEVDQTWRLDIMAESCPGISPTHVLSLNDHTRMFPLESPVTSV